MFLNVTLTLLGGFWGTLKLFALTLLFSLPLGLVISFGSMSAVKIVRMPIRFIIWIIRGTPLMLQLLVMYYGPGIILGMNVWGSGDGGRFVAALVAFVINYSCYFSEIYRGGIQSIPVGQYEAGQVLGMTKTQIFFKVVLLQVIKRIVPPMSNEIITLVKDTSLAYSVALVEILASAQRIAARTYDYFWLYLEAAVVYLIICSILTVLQRRGEKALEARR